MTTSVGVIHRPARAIADATHRLVPLGVGVVAVLLGRWAMLPGIWFWDTAEAQTVGPLLGVMHPTGFPAYVILGWLASVVLQPFGEPAFRMNLLSAILIGAAAAAVVVIGRRLGVPTAVAAASGVGFSATPLAWQMATHADVHALHVALLALLLVLLVRWERARRQELPTAIHPAATSPADRLLVGAAAAYGVSLANHQLTLLLAPAILLFVLAVDAGAFRRWRLVLSTIVASLGVAMLLYLELPLRAGPFPAPLVYGEPDTWEGLRYVVLAEQFRGSLQNPLANIGASVGGLIDRVTFQFGALALLLPAALVATVVRHPRYALLTGVASGTTLLFNAAYLNADIGRYDLGPVLIAWTWLAVLAGAAGEVLAAAAQDRHLLTGGARAKGASALLAAAVVLAPVVPDLPRRHALVDRSTDRSAPAWVDAVLAALLPDAVVVSWWSYSTPLWYAQLIDGRRTDITVVDDRTRLDEGLGAVTDVIDAHLGQRPVYVIRAYPVEVAALERRYVLELVPGTDVLFRVIAPETLA